MRRPAESSIPILPTTTLPCTRTRRNSTSISSTNLIHTCPIWAREALVKSELLGRPPPSRMPFSTRPENGSAICRSHRINWYERADSERISQRRDYTVPRKRLSLTACVRNRVAVVIGFRCPTKTRKEKNLNWKAVPDSENRRGVYFFPG